MARSRPCFCSASPRTLSASPYIGEESKRFASTSSAARTTSWRDSSSRPRTSRTCQVPSPMSGTSMPLLPSLRRSTLTIFRDERLLGAAFEPGDGGEEPAGAGYHLFGCGVEEDVGGVA